MRCIPTPFSKEGLRAIYCHSWSMNSETATLATSTPSQKNDKFGRALFAIFVVLAILLHPIGKQETLFFSPTSFEGDRDDDL